MKHSAGLLLFRRTPTLEVFLGHFGGPHWTNRDESAWTIPKGLIEEGETPFEAARREFEEETGFTPPSSREAYLKLGTVKQSSKQVSAWALEHEIDPEGIECNMFVTEWPPNSGAYKRFPELDRAAYFPLETAAEKIVDGQWPLLERLEKAVVPD